MSLRADDAVVSCSTMRGDGSSLLIVTDGGFGKRTPVEAFTRKRRGGQGVTAIKLTGDKGNVASCRLVGDDDEVLLVTTHGTVIRLAVRDISSQGPYATGVRVMSLGVDERVAAVAPVLQSEDGLPGDDEGEAVAPPADPES